MSTFHVITIRWGWGGGGPLRMGKEKRRGGKTKRGEEGKNREGRVKYCLNKVCGCFLVNCFCYPSFIGHICVLEFALH